MRQHQILEGLEGVEVIADDILVYGKGVNEEEALQNHNQNLRKLMYRLREKNLKLNKTKCKFGLKEVPFYGHILTDKGLRIDQNKMDALMQMPTPRDTRDTQKFIGLCSYLSRFLPNLSTIAEPLRRAVRNGWSWSSEQDEAFSKLKEIISKAPVLRYFDVNKDVTIQCDASSMGLGAVLLQEEHPVACASRVLTKTEQQYAQIEKETLAMVFACKKFDQYICGKRNIIIESDHLPLQTIFKKSILDSPKRLQRMRLSLQRYDLNVCYKKGTEMYFADILSRLCIAGESKELQKAEEIYRVDTEINKLFLEFQEMNSVEEVKIQDERLSRIRTAYNTDKTLQIVQDYVQKGWPDKKNRIKEEAIPFWTYRDQLTLQDGLLLKNDRIVIPKSMRTEMLRRIHYSHQGVSACQRRARDAVFWPGISAEIRQVCEQCDICMQNSATQAKLPMQTPVLPDYPFQRVAMDLCEINEGGQKRIFLVTVDYYSDFFEVDQLPNATTGQIINCCKRNFSRFGIPEVVTTDGGTQFVNQEFQKFANTWEFKHCRSSPNHPRGNGKAEAAVKIMKSLYRKAEKDRRCFWKALLEWRNTSNEIGSSPVQRLMSRRTRCMLLTRQNKLKPELQTAVKQKIEQKKRRTKMIYDKNTKLLPKLEYGQDVWVQLRTNSNNKMWSKGRVTDLPSDRQVIVNIKGTDYLRNREHIRPDKSTGEEKEHQSTLNNTPVIIAQKETSDESQESPSKVTSDASEDQQGVTEKPSSSETMPPILRRSERIKARSKTMQ